MRPSAHIVYSVSVSIVVGYLAKSLYAALICFASGLLLDIDHMIEYIINFGFKDFSLRNCYEACIQTAQRRGPYQFKTLVLIFHGFEIAVISVIFTVITRNLYLLAWTIGYSLHLLLDCIGNSLVPQAYFFIWRAMNGFSAEKIYPVRPRKSRF